MTRYLEISASLAAQVRSRQLPPGTEVPAVRVLVHRWAYRLDRCRAYAHLEQAATHSGRRSRS